MLHIELILIPFYQHYFTMVEENFEIRCSEMLQIALILILSLWIALRKMWPSPNIRKRKNVTLPSAEKKVWWPPPCTSSPLPPVIKWRSLKKTCTEIYQIFYNITLQQLWSPSFLSERGVIIHWGSQFTLVHNDSRELKFSRQKWLGKLPYTSV